MSAVTYKCYRGFMDGGEADASWVKNGRLTIGVSQKSYCPVVGGQGCAAVPYWLWCPDQRYADRVVSYVLCERGLEYEGVVR